VWIFSKDVFHAVKDGQTPFAKCTVDVPLNGAVVVDLPPPPHAAAESATTATAVPPRTRDAS
jgi:hypothetical protein